jgi:hypothetical protein
MMNAADDRIREKSMPEDALGPGDLPREQLTDLRQKIVEHFDDEELRTLCFDTDVDYDILRGQGKEAKARELIDFMQRQGRLGDLIRACRRTRPRVDWNFGTATIEVSPVTPTLTKVPQPPPQAGFLPLDRWQMEVSDGTAWIIDFYPNGSFAGLGIGAWWGAGAQVGGGWSFFIPTQTLQMQGSVNGILPVMVTIVIQGQQGNAYIGFGNDGKSYSFTRIVGA